MLIKVFQQTSAPKAATQHPHGGDTFVDLVGGGRPGQHGVWVSKGHVLRLEILERFLFKQGTLCPQFSLPVVCNISLAKELEGFFCRWRLEEKEGVGQVVHKTQFPNVRKPILASLVSSSEKLCCDGVKDVPI